MQTLTVQNTQLRDKSVEENIKICPKTNGHPRSASEVVKEQRLKNGGRIAIPNSSSQINTVSTGEQMTSATCAPSGVLGAKISNSANKKMGCLTSGSLQFKSFRGSATVRNSTIRMVQPSLNANAATNVIQNSNAVDDAVFKAPSRVVSIDGRKRMKITTVAKKVPLINTVGNQSKLIPMTFPQNLPSSSQPSESSLVQQGKDVSKSLSILHARLTSPAASGSPVDVPPSQLSGSDSRPGLKPSLMTPKEVSEYLSFKNHIMKPKPTLSFEKGVTRLVSVQPRTVMMVDVSTQVYVPQDTSSSEDSDLSHQTPPLAAVSTNISGSSASSPKPLSQQQVFVVNGKKMLAIPRQILRTYQGPKTFVIDGNSVKPKENSSPVVINGAREPIRLHLKAADSAANVGGAPRVILQSANDNPKAHLDSHLSGGDVLVVTSSSHQFTKTAQAPAINTLVASSAASQFSSSQSPLVTVTDKILPIPLSSVLRNSAVSSANTTSVESLSGNADTLILPLHSPIKNSSSEIASLQASPSSSPLLFVMPNNQNSKELEFDGAIHEPVSKLGIGVKRKGSNLSNESPFLKKRHTPTEVIFVENQMGLEPWINLPSVHGNKNRVSHQSRSGPRGSCSDPVVNCNPNGDFHVTSREMIAKHTMSLFSEFRNCLNYNADGKLPIHDAVENNNIAGVRNQCVLLKARNASVNIPNSADETPLQLALYFGHTEIAKELLEQGADATVLDKDGNSTLHVAVLYAEGALEALLLSRQLSKKFINVLNDNGFSALHLAAQHNKVNAINTLIIHGSEVDLPDGSSGRTALYHAVDRKNYIAQKALLESGADMREPTFSGSTPFLITRSDAIAQLTSNQDAVGEEIDLETILKSSRHLHSVKV